MSGRFNSGDPLADAEAALHQLLTTGGLVRMVENGRELAYGPGNVTQLRQYIARLKGRSTSVIRVGTSKGLNR